MTRLHRVLLSFAILLAVGCSSDKSDDGDTDASPPDVALDTAPDADESDAADGSRAGGELGDVDRGGPDGGPDGGGERRARLTHKFPDRTLAPGEEVVPCVQWSLHNDEPLYVNAVTLANEGGFHHSNWFVVPESYAPGADGYYDCDERSFDEITAALQGSVLFAQSTQAQSETQKFPEGVVNKIPPNSKIVADVHFLNIAPREKTTGSRMTLDLIHPADVETVVAPFRLSYLDLKIPPKTESRFTGECNLRKPYETRTGDDFDLKLYYVLPHYHELGNYFELEYFGGPKDGETIFELEGFNAEANGQTFEPPVDLSDADGLRFTCGYDNPRDETVGWGIGDQEMCVMLGFADSETVMDANVGGGTEVVDGNGGVVDHEGPCNALALGQTEAHTPPTSEEKSGELYVPDGAGSDDDLDPVPDCEDTPDEATGAKAGTLTNVSKNIFAPSCAFSSCHGEGGAAGLDLTADDLHAELMNHDVRTPTDLPLVDPGNPEGSWLYKVTSTCNPMANGTAVSHMPRNSPTLLDPKVVAMLRDWIDDGAKDN